MSRKEMMVVAALFAAGQTTCARDDDLFDNSSFNQDVQFLISMNKYVPAAVAMVEAAFNVTFQYPEDYQGDIYYQVGYQFAEHTSWDGSEFDMPDGDFVRQELEDHINDQFRGIASMEQQKAIQSAIKQAWLDNKPA